MSEEKTTDSPADPDQPAAAANTDSTAVPADEAAPQANAAEAPDAADVNAENTPEAANEAVDLEAALAAALQEAKDNQDKYLRAHAEQENIRRRAERDVAAAHKFGVERFAKDLLTVADSLEMGFTAAQADDADAQSVSEGVALTLKQLESVLGNHGIKTLNPLNEPFDPQLHEAISMVPNADLAPNTVMAVVQKGYVLNERVLRAARVVVSQAVPE